MLSILIDFHRFSLILMNFIVFLGFHYIFMDFDELHGFGDSRSGSLWQPVATESGSLSKKYPGPGGWDPRVMEAWRHAGLEDASAACWLMTWDAG